MNSLTGRDALWANLHLGEPLCHFHEIAGDRTGRVWAAGMFRGKVTVGREVFTGTGDSDHDALVCHYGPEGELRWCCAGQGPSTDYALGVATDGAGASYVTGEFSAQFKLGGEVLSSRGGTDVYVAKFDEKGTLRWIAQGGGGGSDNAYSMVCDVHGDLVLGGSYIGAARFDRSNLTGSSRDLFVAKLRGKGPASR